MSVQSEINRISGNIASAYSAISDKGGTLPEDQNSDNLEDAILSIPDVPSAGTEGTPVATKGTVSNHSVSVTPSVTNVGGVITGGTHTGTAVTVTASELVSGTKSITSNGNGQDVTNYASVDVAVPNTYSASDETKVVYNGQLVEQGDLLAQP